MQDSVVSLVETIRKRLSGYKPEEFSLSSLARDLNQPVDTLIASFGNESGLVEEILEYEQRSLEAIFSTIRFSEVSAIDGLLFVSKEISQKFSDIQPSFTFDLRKYYPEAQQHFFEKRVKFVYERMRKHIEQGIQQGVYRQDLSVELVSRIYISRLIDIHNPDFFPADEFSFNTVFEVMFDTFIRGICNEEGIKYYEKKIKNLEF